MLVTLLTDASWCPETHAGGYGFWIATQRGKLGGSGRFRELCNSSSVAEMMAIVNGVYAAVKHELFQPGDKLLIQTDSKDAIGGFLYGLGCGSVQHQGAINYLHSVCQAYSINVLEGTLEFRHVKAHRPSKLGNRYAANNLCDETAKKHMRAWREEIRYRQLLQLA